MSTTLMSPTDAVTGARERMQHAKSAARTVGLLSTQRKSDMLSKLREVHKMPFPKDTIASKFDGSAVELPFLAPSRLGLVVRADRARLWWDQGPCQNGAATVA